MEGDGWVSATAVVQQGRPDKKVYTVSPAGRAELSRWIADPADRDLRDVAVKLRGAGPDDVPRCAISSSPCAPSTPGVSTPTAIWRSNSFPTRSPHRCRTASAPGAARRHPDRTGAVEMARRSTFSAVEITMTETYPNLLSPLDLGFTTPAQPGGDGLDAHRAGGPCAGHRPVGGVLRRAGPRRRRPDHHRWVRANRTGWLLPFAAQLLTSAGGAPAPADHLGRARRGRQDPAADPACRAVRLPSACRSAHRRSRLPSTFSAAQALVAGWNRPSTTSVNCALLAREAGWQWRRDHGQRRLSAQSVPRAPDQHAHRRVGRHPGQAPPDARGDRPAHPRRAQAGLHHRPPDVDGRLRRRRRAGRRSSRWRSRSRAAGATLINSGIGWHEARVPTIVTSVPRAAFVDISNAVADVVDIPVVASNRINMPQTAEQIWPRRPFAWYRWPGHLLADPDWVAKRLRAPTTRSTPASPAIRPAGPRIRAQDRVVSAQSARRPAPPWCSGPPAALARWPSSAPDRPDVAAVSGRPPLTLFGANTHLGSQFGHGPAANSPKEEFAETLRYYATMLSKYGGDATPRVSAPRPPIWRASTTVVLGYRCRPATTGHPRHRPPDGLTYPEAIYGAKPVGRRVAVIGAGGIGFDVSELLVTDESPTLNLKDWKAEWVSPIRRGRGALVRPIPAHPLAGVPAAAHQGPQGRRLGKDHRVGAPGPHLKASKGWNNSRVNYERIDDAGLHISFGPDRKATATAGRRQRGDLCGPGVGARPGRTSLPGLGVTPHVIGGAAVAAELDAGGPSGRAIEVCAVVAFPGECAVGRARRSSADPGTLTGPLTPPHPSTTLVSRDRLRRRRVERPGGRLRDAGRKLAEATAHLDAPERTDGFRALLRALNNQLADSKPTPSDRNSSRSTGGVRSSSWTTPIAGTGSPTFATTGATSSRATWATRRSSRSPSTGHRRGRRGRRGARRHRRPDPRRRRRIHVDPGPARRRPDLPAGARVRLWIRHPHNDIRLIGRAGADRPIDEPGDPGTRRCAVHRRSGPAGHLAAARRLPVRRGRTPRRQQRPALGSDGGRAAFTEPDIHYLRGALATRRTRSPADRGRLVDCRHWNILLQPVPELAGPP